jgi:hypothetical protein
MACCTELRARVQATVSPRWHLQAWLIAAPGLSEAREFNHAATAVFVDHHVNEQLADVTDISQHGDFAVSRETISPKR